MDRTARSAQIDAEVRAAQPDLSPEEHTAAVTERHNQDYLSVIQYALADVPEDRRLMVAEEMLAEHPEVAAAITQGHDLGAVSDATERAMITETTARANSIVAAATAFGPPIILVCQKRRNTKKA